LHITWTDIWKTWHACINLFVYITGWRFKSSFVMQWANFLVVSTYKCLVRNATTLSFYNNLSPRLYFILLYFITLNNFYCTATSKNYWTMWLLYTLCWSHLLSPRNVTISISMYFVICTDLWKENKYDIMSCNNLRIYTAKCNRSKWFYFSCILYKHF
jgi:hypothetical protein